MGYGLFQIAGHPVDYRFVKNIYNTVGNVERLKITSPQKNTTTMFKNHIVIEPPFRVIDVKTGRSINLNRHTRSSIVDVIGHELHINLMSIYGITVPGVDVLHRLQPLGLRNIIAQHRMNEIKMVKNDASSIVITCTSDTQLHSLLEYISQCYKNMVIYYEFEDYRRHIKQNVKIINGNIIDPPNYWRSITVYEKPVNLHTELIGAIMNLACRTGNTRTI